MSEASDAYQALPFNKYSRMASKPGDNPCGEIFLDDKAMPTVRVLGGYEMEPTEFGADVPAITIPFAKLPKANFIRAGDELGSHVVRNTHDELDRAVPTDKPVCKACDGMGRTARTNFCGTSEYTETCTKCAGKGFVDDLTPGEKATLAALRYLETTAPPKARDDTYWAQFMQAKDEKPCGHKKHEDCMTCCECGECSESLDSNDVCGNCRADEPTVKYDSNLPRGGFF